MGGGGGGGVTHNTSNSIPDVVKQVRHMAPVCKTLHSSIYEISHFSCDYLGT